MLLALQQQVDAHFDRVATIVEQARRVRVRTGCPPDDDRRWLAEYVQSLQRDLAVLRPQASALDDARAAARDAQGELRRLKATRTFRYSALPRRLYGRLRRRGR